MSPYFLINTALINHMADVPNATAPRAWSADFYKMLHPATAYYAMFRRLQGLDCHSSNS